MPRFYFDISDGGLMVDDTGTEFPNAHAACDVALRTLPDVARAEMGKRDSREIVLLMRDAEGKAMFTASLKLTAEWLMDAA